MGEGRPEGIQLRLLTEEAFHQVVKWNEKEDKDFLRQWAGVGYDYPLLSQQFSRRLAQGVNVEEGTIFVYGIYDGEDRMVGTIELAGIDRKRQLATICRFLIGNKEDRGLGIGKEALSLLIDMAYRSFGIKMIFLKVFDFNEYAISCYESIGFRAIKCEERSYRAKDGEWNQLTMVYIDKKDIVTPI